MIINIERGNCFGRGFDEISPGGFLQNFLSWVQRTPVPDPTTITPGGPGWYLIDDQSTAITDPYVVVSNNLSVANKNQYTIELPDYPNGTPKILKVGYTTATGGQIYVDGYIWWDTGTHTGYRWSAHLLTTTDAGLFNYDFRGGPEFIGISAKASGTWTNFISGEWDGDLSFVEGPDKVGTFSGDVSSGTDVSVDLASGQGALFTPGKYYYIYDFSTGTTIINYAKIVSVTGDTIVIDNLSQSFPTDSVIGSYVHRFFACGTTTAVAPGSFGAYYSLQPIPYCSYKTTGANPENCYSNDGPRIAVSYEVMGHSLSIMAPNDVGTYLGMRGNITELYNGSNNLYVQSDDMNRAYGPLKGTYIGSPTGMLAMSDGRKIGGLQYMLAWTDSYTGRGILIPDYNSVI